jgi:uncharacterized damage-inducible protein DinB
MEVPMVPDVYQELMRHMEWADAQVWRSVLTLPQAESDKRVRDCLYHLHVVQWAYLQIWRDETPDVPDVSSFEDLPAIHSWGREYYRQVAEQLDGLSVNALDRQVRFPWAEQLVERFGGPAPATLAETILQITSHTTYHRGQINMRLRELGAEPPLTDFIAWIWMGKPGAEWEEHTGA